MSQKRVYLFGNGKAEGNAKMREELGGKGANLAEMNHIGVPVPPGFTITTDCCNEYYQVGQEKIMELLNDDVMAAVKHIENLMNCKFGDAHDGYHPEPGIERRGGRGYGKEDQQSSLRLRLLPSFRTDVR